jgi:hypothetical protein
MRTLFICPSVGLKSLLIGIVTLFAACTVHAGDSEGANGGGGGNVTRTETTVEGMRSMINLAVKLAFPVMYLASQDKDNKRLSPKVDQLFKTKRLAEIADEYSAIKVLIKENGACLHSAIEDRNGVSLKRVFESDASADPATNEICFSIKRLLAGNFSLGNLIALSVHEFAHLKGENEESAETTQRSFDFYFHRDVLSSGADFVQAASNIFTGLNGAFEATRFIESAKNKYKLCSDVEWLRRNIDLAALSSNQFPSAASLFLPYTRRLYLRGELLSDRLCNGADEIFQQSFGAVEFSTLIDVKQALTVALLGKKSEGFVNFYGAENNARTYNFFDSHRMDAKYRLGIRKEMDLFRFELTAYARIMKTIFEPTLRQTQGASFRTIEFLDTSK